MNNSYNRQYSELSNGVKLSYIDEGAGEQTIIFIHGLSNYALGWQKNIDELKKSHRCIAIDLPGNGFSSRGDYAYTMSFFADCIHDLITKLKLTNVCLCGHSMGGQIAIATTLKYPDAISKLVLCAPAGFEEFTESERMMYIASIKIFDAFSSDENSLRKTTQSSFYMFPGEAKEMVNDLVEILRSYPMKDYKAMIEACIYNMLYEPVFDKLLFITQPTLVLFGDKDTLIPNKILHPFSTKQIAEKGTAQLLNADMHIISQCGHFLQWEKAGHVNSYINSFLNGGVI